MAEVTPRAYILWQITGVMGEALALARSVHGGNPERALDVYGQEIIDRLKALPADAPRGHVRKEVTDEEGAKALVYLNTHDTNGNVLSWELFWARHPVQYSGIRKNAALRKLLEDVMGPMPPQAEKET